MVGFPRPVRAAPPVADGPSARYAGGPPRTECPMDRPALRLFRRSAFTRLFLARTISTLGTSIGSFAIAFAILDLPNGSATTVGVVLGALSVATIAATLVGGLLGDRFRRSTVLAAGEGLSGVGALGVGIDLLLRDGSLPVLAAFAALYGAGMGIFGPVLSAMVADVVPDEELRQANGLLRLSGNVARIAGVGVAGALVTIAGGAAAMLLDAASFLVSMLLIGSTWTAGLTPSGGSLVDDLHRGWREFVARSWVVAIVAAAFVINAAWAAVVGVYGPLLATSELGGPASWAFVTMAGTVGAVAGTVIALRIPLPRPLLIGMICYASFGAIPLALALRLPVPALAVIFFAVHVGLDILAVGWDTVMQRQIPREALSRVSAYDWLGSSAATPVGFALAGPILDVLDIHAVLAGAAVVILVTGLLPIAVRDVRRMELGSEPQPGG